MPLTRPRTVHTILGRLDRWITIEQLTDSESDTGFPVESWAPLAANVAAGKEDLSERERFTVEQTSAPYDVRWEIAYRADMDHELLDVTKRRRITYAGRIYNIVHAGNLGRRYRIELLTLSSGG